MFSKKFLQICFYGKQPDHFINSAIRAAVFFGIVFPFISAIISLFGKDFRILAYGLSLFKFSGIMSGEVSGFLTGVVNEISGQQIKQITFLDVFLSSLSINLLLYSFLLFKTRLPFIPVLMITDLIIGKFITNKAFADNPELMLFLPELKWINLFLFIFLLVVFLYALIGSLLHIRNYLEFRKLVEYN